MQLNDEIRIDAPREQVYAALNDPEILQNAIPGCEEIQQLSETELIAAVVTRIGPIKAKFTGHVTLFDSNPDVVAELSALADACRADIGDDASGVAGKNIRPAGRVDNPETLTHYHPDHPYIYAEYDKAERG